LATPGVIAGRYELLGRLGSGGMATVYLARDNVLDVQRAIKVIAPELTRRRQVRERFINEAKVMAMLEHPNIVRLYDIGIDGDQDFMVMEVLQGGTLLDRVELLGPLPPRQAADVFDQVLAALSEAHRLGIVHRDVKPHNILLDKAGTPKVTDFGIARLVHAEKALTRTGAMMGTFAYMAPEQRTRANEAEPPADVYAVGCTLYAVLTGEEPIDLFMPLHQERFGSRFIAPIAALLTRATAYRPEDRFQSADEMRAALAAIYDDLPNMPSDAPPLALEGFDARVGELATDEQPQANGTFEMLAGPVGGDAGHPTSSLDPLNVSTLPGDEPISTTGARTPAWVLPTFFAVLAGVALGGSGAWFFAPNRSAAPTDPAGVPAVTAPVTSPVTTPVEPPPGTDEPALVPPATGSELEPVADAALAVPGEHGAVAAVEGTDVAAVVPPDAPRPRRAPVLGQVVSAAASKVGSKLVFDVRAAGLSAAPLHFLREPPGGPPEYVVFVPGASAALPSPTLPTRDSGLSALRWVADDAGVRFSLVGLRATPQDVTRDDQGFILTMEVE